MFDYEIGFDLKANIYELSTDKSSNTGVLINVHFRLGHKFGKP